MIVGKESHPEAYDPRSPSVGQQRWRMLALIIGIFISYIVVLRIDGLTLDWVGIGVLVVSILGILLDLSIKINANFRNTNDRLQNIESYLQYAVKGRKQFRPRE